MSINQLNISTENLLAPTDADGAIIVRGLHMNTIIDRVNEIAALYLSAPTISQVKVADYNYKGAGSGASIHFEDLKQVINMLNSIASPFTPLSYQLIKNTSFRTPDDSVEVKKLHLDQIVKSINVVIDKVNLTPVQFKVEYDGTNQFSLKFKAPITSTLEIHDGDGTVTDVAGNDGTEVVHTTTYATAGTYFFYVLGDVLDLTALTISSEDLFSLTVLGGNLDKLTNVTSFRATSLDLVSNISNLPPNVTTLALQYCTSIEGDISGFAFNNVALTLRWCDGVTFNDSVVIASPTVNAFIMSRTFTPIMLDNAINCYQNSLVNKFVVFINYSGRTSASNAALIKLITIKAKITIVDSVDVGVLGAELYTVANAIAIGTEADAISDITAVGLGAPNEFESQSEEVDGSSYAIKINSNPNPNASVDVELTTPVVVEVGKHYKFSRSLKALENREWHHFVEYVDGAYTAASVFEEARWLKYATYITPGDVSLTYRLTHGNLYNDGGGYLDNLSVKEVTLP